MIALILGWLILYHLLVCCKVFDRGIEAFWQAITVMTSIKIKVRIAVNQNLAEI